MQRFNLSVVEAGLSTYLIGKSGPNEIWDSIASTNDRAIELALAGAAEGVIVLARQQTGGRGRQGRTWVSPPDSGIYISFILRPTIDASMLPLISFAGGVAASAAIERVVGKRIGLKWVNDLVVDGRKLGGILAEMPGSQFGSGGGENRNGWILAPAVILGIGINLSLRDADVSDELKGRIICLDDFANAVVNANDLISELCCTLEDQYNHLRHGASELVLSEWKQFSHTIGKRIRAKIGNEEFEGTAAGLADDGALRLILADGSEQLLHAGEISIRLEDGRYA